MWLAYKVNKNKGIYFLFQLVYYIQESTDFEDLKAVVVAAKNRKQDHYRENVIIFFLLPLTYCCAFLIMGECQWSSSLRQKSHP